MKRDLGYIIGVLLVSVLLGLSLGQFFLILFLGTLGLFLWQTSRLYNLYNWLKKPKKNPIYETQGVVAMIHKEAYQHILSNRRRKKQIAHYLNLFRAAISAVPDAVILIDEKDRIEWANEKANDLLSINWPKDANVRLSNLLRYPEIQELLNQILIENKEKTVLVSLDSQTTISLKITRYDHKFRMIIAHDMSQIINAYTAQKIFVANASHELKTPLTVITGYLEILLRHNKLSETDESTIKKINEQSLRMQVLVEDLLYLSKLEMQNSQIKMSSVNLLRLIEKILTTNENNCLNKQLKITVDIKENFELLGEEKALYNLFSNLILNAINYNNEHGSIAIKARKEDGNSVITISDTGIGISPLEIPKLTKRFYRVDNNRSRMMGGTGLGLAIVKQVLQKHDAQLKIDSQLDKGSSFECIFPNSNIIYDESIND